MTKDYAENSAKQISNTPTSEKPADSGADNVIPLHGETDDNLPDDDQLLVPGKGGPRPPHYRKTLLKLLTIALLRNSEAHRNAANTFLSRSLRSNVFSVISTLLLCVLATWETARRWFDASPLHGAFSYDTVMIIVGVVAACFGMRALIQRPDDKANAHKEAADSFSALRRDAVVLLGETSISAESVRRIVDQYNLIVRLCPMVPPSIWKKFDKTGDIDRMLQKLFDLAHRD